MTEATISFHFNQIRALPNVPAVYGVWAGELCLYVGQSWKLRDRLATHNRLLEFIEFSADRITVTRCAPKELAKLETNHICWLKPLLNDTRLTRHERETNSLMAQSSRLYQATHDALTTHIAGRAASPVLKEIEAATSLSYAWLTSFLLHRCGNPAVNRVEELYEHLTGKPLEFK